MVAKDLESQRLKMRHDRINESAEDRLNECSRDRRNESVENRLNEPAMDENRLNESLIRNDVLNKHVMTRIDLMRLWHENKLNKSTMRD